MELGTQYESAMEIREAIQNLETTIDQMRITMEALVPGDEQNTRQLAQFLYRDFLKQFSFRNGAFVHSTADEQTIFAEAALRAAFVFERSYWEGEKRKDGRRPAQTTTG